MLRSPLLLYLLHQRDATEFGILKTDENNNISSFIEKPKLDVLPQWISETGEEMKKEEGSTWPAWGFIFLTGNCCLTCSMKKTKETTDFGKEIIPSSIEKHRVVSYQYDGYWTDIGNIHSFFEANLSLCQDIPPFNLFDNTKTVYTRARMLRPAKVSGTTLEKTIVADAALSMLPGWKIQ
jgi:glucose-1-phosphate adenylyltransferase